MSTSSWLCMFSTWGGGGGTVNQLTTFTLGNCSIPGSILLASSNHGTQPFPDSRLWNTAKTWVHSNSSCVNAAETNNAIWYSKWMHRGITGNTGRWGCTITQLMWTAPCTIRLNVWLYIKIMIIVIMLLLMHTDCCRLIMHRYRCTHKIMLLWHCARAWTQLASRIINNNIVQYHSSYCIAGNFRGRKLSRMGRKGAFHRARENFAECQTDCIDGYGMPKISWRKLLRVAVKSWNSWRFSPSKVSRYMVS